MNESDSPGKMTDFTPPRRASAGETGRYQIVFKSGTVTTLDNVRLWPVSLGGQTRATFEANFANGWKVVSFGPNGAAGGPDPEQIVGIFRITEDLKGPTGKTEDERRREQELVLAVELEDGIRSDGQGGSVALASATVDFYGLARSQVGIGLVFEALFAETHARGSLVLAADGEALTLTVIGATCRYKLDPAAAAGFAAWVERHELARSDEPAPALDESSEAFDAHLEALLEPIQAALDVESAAKGSRRRGFSPGERAQLRAIYFDSINYDDVVVTGRHFFSPFLSSQSAMTLANKIIYPVRAWRPDFSATADMALLCHETCHIWQSQNIPRYNALRAGLEHLRYGDRVYEYSIRTHERLTDYRFEQQGQILQDWWSMNGNIFVPAELRERYAKVIYASIST